jgi:hypothetical protein
LITVIVYASSRAAPVRATSSCAAAPVRVRELVY